MTDPVSLTSLQQHGRAADSTLTGNGVELDNPGGEQSPSGALGSLTARSTQHKPSVIERFIEALANAISKLRHSDHTPVADHDAARVQVQKQLSDRQINTPEDPLKLKDVREITRALAPPKSAFDVAPSLVQRRTIGPADKVIFDGANISHSPVLSSTGAHRRTDGIGALPASSLHLTADKTQSLLREATAISEGTTNEQRQKLQPLIDQLTLKTQQLSALEQSKLLPGSDDAEGQKQAADQLQTFIALNTDIDEIANQFKKLSTELIQELEANIPEGDAAYRAFQAQWQAVNQFKTSLNGVEAQTLASQINAVNAIRGVIQGYQHNDITVGQALQLAAVGLELDTDSQSDVLTGKNWQFVKSQNGQNTEVGKGETGDVLKIVANPNTPDETVAVFKPLQTRQSQAAVLGEFSAFLPTQRSEARNVAVSNIDQTLGLNVAPASAIVNVEGQWGLALEYVRGDSNGHGVFHDHPELSVSQVLGNGAALKDLSNLEVLDVLVGQLDRHGGNYLVEIDPVTQAYKGLKGIDHDHCLLPTETVDVSRLRGRHLPDAQDAQLKSEGWGTSYGFKGVGLPNFIDRKTYQALIAPDAKSTVLKSVSGLIEAEAIEALAQRWDVLVEHAKTLESRGRIVDDWQAREGEIIDTQKRELDHSYFAQHSLKRFGENGELGTVDLETPLRPPLR